MGKDDAARWLLKWHPQADVQDEGGTLVIQSPLSQIALRRPSRGLRAALELLSGPGADEDQLADRFEELDGPHNLARLFYVLGQASEKGLLAHVLEVEGERLACVVPLSGDQRFRPQGLSPDSPCRLRLCRFACARRQDGQLLMESPLSPWQVALYGWKAAALFGVPAGGCTIAELHSAVSGISLKQCACLAGLLLDAGLAWRLDAQGQTPDELPPLLQWEFHDLYFHSRSRMGWHLNPIGATFPYPEQLPPAVKPAPPQPRQPPLDLHRPDIEELKGSDPPYCRVQEQRKSIRDYGEDPLTVRQVGEFLYRVARVRRTFHIQGHELTSRPYPGGGACHPLEFYLVVRSCRGIPAGLFHYQPVEHRLQPLDAPPSPLDGLLQTARWAVGEKLRPQILIVLTARFQRLSWKYQSVVYATVLKEVGVVMQTMYLAATAMGLAGCALGSGDSRLFCQAAGLDFCSESPVGEFLLGGHL